MLHKTLSMKNLRKKCERENLKKTTLPIRVKYDWCKTLAVCKCLWQGL